MARKKRGVGEMPLNGKQRAYLRRLGQEQEPIVMIGKAGLTATLRVQLEDALQARELVKCRSPAQCSRRTRGSGLGVGRG